MLKAVEVLLEQTVIGLLTVIIVALPFVDASKLPDWSTGPLSVVLLIVAYVLGTVMDRAIDSLVDGLDRCHRLRFAALRILEGINAAHGMKTIEWKEAEAQWPGGDPFREGDLKSRARTAAEGWQGWIDYLRTRIRFARTSIVLTPVAGFALAIHCLNAFEYAPGPYPERLRVAVMTYFGVIFAASVVGGLAMQGRQPSNTKNLLENGQTYWDRRKLGTPLPMRHEWGWIRGSLWDTIVQPANIPALVSTVAFVVAGLFEDSVEWGFWATFALPTGVVWALSLWAFWRISWSYRHGLMRAARELDRAAGSTPLTGGDTVEVERRFLIPPSGIQHWGVSVVREETMTQGYLSTDPEATIRIRVTGDRPPVLTIKGRKTGSVASEHEYLVRRKDGESLRTRLKHVAEGNLVEKRRQHLNVSPNQKDSARKEHLRIRSICLDEFLGDLSELFILEVEFDDLAPQSADLEARIERWCSGSLDLPADASDITEDHRYANARLARHGVPPKASPGGNETESR